MIVKAWRRMGDFLRLKRTPDSLPMSEILFTTFGGSRKSEHV
jgi:hypothetical protein